MIVHRREDVRGQYRVIDRLYQGGSEGEFGFSGKQVVG